MKTKNWLILFHIILTFLFSFSSYSQDKNKEAAPLFILQGTVKIKGKPVEDVSLVLEKNQKQIAKNSTPKSGIYYFQMAKSNSDITCEYQLNIIKSGIAEGVLLINTYIPKDEFTPVPYVFNLEIGLTAPAEGSSTIEKKDFGKIRWFSEKKEFDFDKEYAITVEKEKQHKKEQEREKAIADSVKAEQEKIEFAKKVEQQKLDSIANEIKNKNVTELTAKTNTNPETNTANKTVDKISSIAANSNNNKTKGSASSNKKNNGTKSNSIDSNKNSIENQNNSITANKNQKTNNVKHSDSESHKTNDNENNSANKITNNTLTKNGTATASNNNSKDISNSLIKGNNAKLNTSDANQTIANASSSQTKNNATNNGSSNDTSYTNSSIKRDLFFLTGVPMGQFKKNLVDASVDANNTFDTENLADLTNERNRLMSEKARMARKKAENFAKKHETNNTLTSLLNIVDEYEKR